MKGEKGCVAIVSVGSEGGMEADSVASERLDSEEGMEEESMAGVTEGHILMILARQYERVSVKVWTKSLMEVSCSRLCVQRLRDE